MANYEVSPETNKIIKEYAERIGCKPEEGVERLIKTAASRKASLIKYAAENPRTKKAPKAKAKKAAPKGTSIAKKAPKAKAAPKAKKPDFSAAEEAMEAAKAKAAAKASA